MNTSCEDRLNQLIQNINEGNHEEAERILNQILLGNRNKEIDKNFIETLEGKPLLKNMNKVLRKDSSLEYLDYAKLVSSLITHCFIKLQHENILEDELPIKDLYTLLGEVILKQKEETEIQKDIQNFIQERYAEFMNK